MSEDARHAEAADKRSIAFECDLPEAPDKVWRALTTPEIVSEWLLPTDLRPQAGTRFGFRDAAAREEPIECEVLDVEPERSIRFSWRDAGGTPRWAQFHGHFRDCSDRGRRHAPDHRA